MATKLEKRASLLKGQYKSLWWFINSPHGLTSIEAADMRISLNLSRRCTELEEKLGVIIQREPFTLPSGIRCKRYSWRPEGKK